MAAPSQIVPGQNPRERYSRQVLFSPIGAEGQEKIGQARVAIVGVGATGAAAASLLARAGVGSLTLIDRDFVEESNLQRQVLFDETDAREALPKAEAARRKIAAFNSEIELRAEVADLVPANIHELLQEAQIVLDATDNFETRYLLNDYSIEQHKPWIYAAAVGAYAVTMDRWSKQQDAPDAALLRRLEQRMDRNFRRYSATRVYGLRRTRFCASARRGPAAYYPVRSQLRPDPRALPPHRSRRDGGST